MILKNKKVKEKQKMKRRYLSTLAGTMAAAMMVCGGTVFAEETPDSLDIVWVTC